MWEPKRNNDKTKNLFQLWEVRVAFFIYFNSAISLFLFHFIFGKANFTHVLFFILGISLEFIIFLICYSSYRKRKINKAQLRQYVYVLYTVLGLPFSIYLALHPFYGIIALLRFLAILVFLFSFVTKEFVKWHIFLFFCGFFCYQYFLLGENFFSTKQWSLFIFYIFGAIFVWYREKWIKLLQKKYFYIQIQKRRFENKYKKYQSYVEKIIKRTGSSVTSLETKERSLYSNSGIYLLVQFSFYKLYEAFLVGQMETKMTTKSLQQEKEIFLDYICQKYSNFQIEISYTNESILIGKNLKKNILSPKKDFLSSLSSIERKEIFEIFFINCDLLEFVKRTRLSIESRGQEAWYTNIFMGLGQSLVMQSYSNDPSLAFYGPIVKELEKISKISEKEMFQTEVIEERIWLQPYMQNLFENYFDLDTALSRASWKSPDFLLSTYTQDRTSIKPNAYFWASLEIWNDLLK